ncbi:MAG TPA: NADH:flavin oxidoreductase [Mycobacterium sp.]|mgnify:CR=1 FL=1|uniref:NADH:flavin oxidoreductase n=1 Tax=Mycolicibacterium sp. TaxID=2320850 RepID=UPI0025E3F098|nr:NADH:flavin oxidoreductase [Mycolicibacterium sp.]HPX36718.1 NADH:flavin oxidoreductase [Mycobacterium sp.]HQC76692.1 NADH:flavin oxidoreductase [Mycobacterium sp.]
MSNPFEAVTFTHGPAMKNRFMLAPLTNQQSNPDGTLSDDEERWLTMRAAGGFGMTMTCASHVDALGQGFAGQLGCFGDEHLPGLTRLAAGIHAQGSLAVVQLHHAGRRAPAELIGTAPVAPAADAKTGARAMTTVEVREVIESFVAAAVRCDKAGFDGVEIHGAHDYLLCQFLNAGFNNRTDEYGGSREARFRIVAEIITGIRERCRPDFILGVRISPERFGLATADMIDAFERLAATETVDFIDLSLWDVFKDAVDEEFAPQPLLKLFTALDRGSVRLAVAGHLYSGSDVQRALDLGADIVAIGRAAITNHDFPRLVQANPTSAMRELPVPREVLVAEGLGPAFLGYMANWEGFVGD